MSIKSQKSLNEECLEIIERSYSVRSPSEESFSCDDEDECLARELMNKLTPAVLSKLRRCFKKSKERSRARDIDRRVEEVMRAAAAEEGIEFAAPAPAATTLPLWTLWLHEDGFVAALDNIFGHHKYTTHAHKLFQLLDPFRTGRVWWRQLITRLVDVGAKKTRSRAEVWTPVQEKGIKRLTHCKRETIVKLVNIEREDSFCYVAVSKGGRVGVYSGQIKLLYSYEVFYHRTGLHRRVKNCWITDALYLSDAQCLVLSASDRSLTVYDASTLTHTPIYCITGMPNIPTCMAYSPSRCSGGSNGSELALGTERGDIVRLRFLQPKVALFHNKTPDNINYYFWMELASPPHGPYCSVATWRRCHARPVRRVRHARDGDVLLSCSHDAAASLRARHAPGMLDDYVYTVHRGVTCFHVVPHLHLLATGSCDGVVRLWETTHTEGGMPFATLATPAAAAVLDVAVLAAAEIVVAFCNNCCLYIWDLYEECLLQTVRIKFPFLGVLGKKVEFGAYCIHPGPARKKLVEEELSPTLAPEATSRRGSSVYQGSTGGLILQPEPNPDNWQTRKLEQEPEYIRFNRPEILITCCDHVCTVELSPRAPLPAPLSPPGDTLRARRPSFWDLNDDVLMETARRPRSPSPAPTPVPRAPAPQLLTPTHIDTTHNTHELDTLLEKAGLQGILEKDFVLMQGLKHDLNRKLAEMKANMDSMCGAVSAGAPYLALRTYEPVPMDPVDEMTDEYKRVMRLFPGSSIPGTPAGSGASTPRKTKCSKL